MLKCVMLMHALQRSVHQMVLLSALRLMNVQPNVNQPSATVCAVLMVNVKPALELAVSVQAQVPYPPYAMVYGIPLHRVKPPLVAKVRANASDSAIACALLQVASAVRAQKLAAASEPSWRQYGDQPTMPLIDAACLLVDLSPQSLAA